MSNPNLVVTAFDISTGKARTVNLNNIIMDIITRNADSVRNTIIPPNLLGTSEVVTPNEIEGVSPDKQDEDIDNEKPINELSSANSGNFIPIDNLDVNGSQLILTGNDAVADYWDFGLITPASIGNMAGSVSTLTIMNNTGETIQVAIQANEGGKVVYMPALTDNGMPIITFGGNGISLSSSQGTIRFVGYDARSGMRGYAIVVTNTYR